MSAGALGASVYEAAQSIGYIGDDNEAANLWLNHGNQGFSFPGVSKRVNQSIKNADIPENEIKEVAKRAREEYRLLCNVKRNDSSLKPRMRDATVTPISVTSLYGTYREHRPFQAECHG